jgi:hypothetical protein
VTELEAVAGLVAGRLNLRDVAHLSAKNFDDDLLGKAFAVATSWMEMGARATPERIAQVFLLQKWDVDGLKALLKGG